MTTKEFVALEERLLPNFHGFVIKKRMMVISPVEHVLRGFHFEPSDFSKQFFYVMAFFLPLFVPTRDLHFTFGYRITRNKKGWSSDQPDLEVALISSLKKEVPFLSNLQTPKDITRGLEPFVKPNKHGYVNPHCLEAFAYALLQAGEVTTATNTINALLQSMNPIKAWESEIVSRVQIIGTKLLKDPEDARKQLSAWEQESVYNLGLKT